MKKKDERPRETMRMVIEFADNGIILRDPGCEDSVLLALSHGTKNESGYGYDIDHSDEFRAIGRRVYHWLVEDVIPEYSDRLVCTGAELEVVARLEGRGM